MLEYKKRKKRKRKHLPVRQNFLSGKTENLALASAAVDHRASCTRLTQPIRMLRQDVLVRTFLMRCQKKERKKRRKFSRSQYYAIDCN